MDEEVEILDDAALARRWFLDGSPEAVARRLDRITEKKRAGHLKSFKGGNKRLYRIDDVREFEARAKFMLGSYGDDPPPPRPEIKKHDPEVFAGLREWLDLSKFP